MGLAGGYMQNVWNNTRGWGQFGHGGNGQGWENWEPSHVPLHPPHTRAQAVSVGEKQAEEKAALHKAKSVWEGWGWATRWGLGKGVPAAVLAASNKNNVHVGKSVMPTNKQ